MLNRNSTDLFWFARTDLAIGADFFVQPGNEFSDFLSAPGVVTSGLWMPTLNMRYFSIDILTDDLVEVDIVTSKTVVPLGGETPLVTLFCPAALRHNTVYDLAPPFNQNGALLITADYLAIRARNVSGNVVSPFVLTARVWR